MLFPTRNEIRRALLLALADGRALDSDQVEAIVADILDLSEAQRSEPYGNGQGTRLGNEIDWVKGAEDKGFGYFERVGPKLYRLTPRGKRAAVGGIDLDRETRTVRRPGSPSRTDLEQLVDADAETLRRDPDNIPALNRTARRHLERGDNKKQLKHLSMYSRSIRQIRSLPSAYANCEG
jgi:Mrr N-terminal domain